MIFFLIMPILIGSLGNMLIPIICSSTEIIYPRINNISLIIIPTSYMILIMSLICEYGNGLGWTLYPPLSTSNMILVSIGIDLLIHSLLISGISTSGTSLNYILTCHIWKTIIIPLS